MNTKLNLKEVADELGWSEIKVQHLYNSLFSYVLQELKNPQMNTIHLQGLGKFYVKKLAIDRVIQAYIKQIRKGEGDPEILKQKIRNLWEARKNKDYRRV